MSKNHKTNAGVRTDGHSNINVHKEHFPTLVGKHATEAEDSIKSERPDLTVVKVHKDSMVTMDFKDTRIRLWVDDNGVVVRPPTVG